MVTVVLVKKWYKIKVRYDTTAVQTELECDSVQLQFDVKAVRNIVYW